MKPTRSLADMMQGLESDILFIAQELPMIFCAIVVPIAWIAIFMEIYFSSH